MRPDNRAWRRSGFTLMELMVSVAILLAVLAMIGAIFATTSKAGGNATSMSLMHRQLAQVAETLARDLEYVTPGAGGAPMGIAGKLIPAYETAKDQNSGVPLTSHRADTLMLFTTAAQDTYRYKHDPMNPELSPLAQVVYGHADVAKFDPNSGQIDLTTLKKLEDGKLPVAAEWHLARRVIRSLAGMPLNPAPTGAYVGPVSYPVTLTATPFLTGECEVLWYPVAGVTSLFPTPGVLQFLNSNVTAFPDYPAPTSFGSYAIYANKLFTLGSADGRWWASASPWARFEWDGSTAAAVTTGVPSVHNNPSVVPYLALQKNQFYDLSAGANQPNRSVIDPKPPLGIDHAMRWNFLPGCSEFKVEYTYDNPRELTMMGGNIDLTPRPVRWYSVPPDGQIIWSNVSVSPKDSAGDPAPTDPRRWPRAIRITLRAWDPGGRLADPVTRTIVHTW